MNAKWGEDFSVGPWAGAATNGDVAVMFVINSCGHREPLFTNLLGAFAGVALINIIAPNSYIAPNHYADAQLNTSVGSILASYALANPDGLVASAWAATARSMGQFQGTGCPNMDNNFTNGGGHGLYGCGSWDSMAAAASAGQRDINASITWNQARLPIGYDSDGTQFYKSYVSCNYDCLRYGFAK